MSLLVFKTTSLAEYLGYFLSSKLLITLTILPSLLFVIRKSLIVQPIVNKPNRLVIKAKSITIILFLISILLYSHIMARLGFKPFGSFVFEYLILLPFLIILTPWYTAFSSKRQLEPEDEYAQFGYYLLRLKKFEWVAHKQLILKSLIKILFIPIMVGALFDSSEFLLMYEWHLHPLVFLAGLFIFGLTFDLIIAASGYVFASKLLGNDVKSADPYISGWLVCLICYPPFLIIYQWIKKQSDNFLWHDWLSVEQPLYWVWAFILSLSWIIYWISTANFGLRFSNLTWRGIVNTGPYAYTKHPAYIAKNIYWWLHTVPFYGVSTSYELVRNLLGLLFVSSIYYLRAKTEERHLMHFAEYQEYAKYINEHGIFSKLKAIVFNLSKKFRL